MLPGVGFSEILIIGLAALIFVGPKDLPMLMRRAGEFIGKGRRMAREFQSAFEDIARQSELEELKKEIQALKQSNVLTKAQEDLAAVEADINSAVMRAHPTAPEAAIPAPAEPPPAGESKA
jgi:sec-independent protein translocase protein TatB